MEVFSLSKKKILVTGASSGIGRQIAISASESGAEIFLTARNKERLTETYSRLSKGNHSKISADLTIEKEIIKLVDELPKLDGVVFSAGITTHMPVKFIREKDIEAIFKINYHAQVLTTARILKKKKVADGASLIFLSSIGSKYPYFGGSNYSASKSALEAYVRVLASELAPKKIRANCLSPTFVKTPMVDGASETISEEAMGRFEKMSPLGFGEPEDVANTAIFFLSDAARWITGTNLPLGGM